MARLPVAWLLAAALLLGACAGSSSSGSGSGTAAGCSATFSGSFSGTHANRVISYDPINSTGATADEWPYFFDGCAAMGDWMGHLDVASLGYDKAASSSLGGSIVLGLGSSTADSDNACITDGSSGDGADFIVYENPFTTTDGGETGTNSEVALVAVSQNNSDWYTFPANQDMGLSLIDPDRYTGYAGVHESAGGGDRFDLATVIAAEPVLDSSFQACYVRLTDGGTAHTDYGNTQSDMYASGSDIDGITVVHGVASPGLSP